MSSTLLSNLLYLPKASSTRRRARRALERRDERFRQTSVWSFLSSSTRRLIKPRSLTVNQQMRPTPGDMLSHPWIVLMMERKADMAEFICKVYGWKRRSGDPYVDRHIHRCPCELILGNDIALNQGLHPAGLDPPC